jgi:hypothetical protein
MQSLIYVNIIGKNAEDEYVYEFYFSDEPEMAWGVDWDIKPAAICNLSVPQKMNYDVIKILKTNITLSVAQKNSCFSMQDCKDGIIPIAWENIDGYDEYPEEGRIVLAFGVELKNVEQMLNKRSLMFEGATNSETFDF